VSLLMNAFNSLIADFSWSVGFSGITIEHEGLPF
ncbi:MAG: hypothetical protein QG641_2020, partial [Candidatus Poribacteria bacterium]|nr:hypothetical protein [Candidatus Poribacteria bacterium]